ncbi:MAG: LysM peptidoglycan-binding domain-containing protein [Gemmatimonadota bacterium]
MAAEPALGQQPPQTQAQPKQHVVRPGDTLWDLANQYLSDPFRWPMIFEANRTVVENPHRIYPAERLVIPGVPADRLAVVVAVEEPAGPPQRTRFYTGSRADAPTLIASELEATKLVQRGEWLAAPWIADSASLGINATVFKPMDPRSQGDKLRQTFHPRDDLILSTTDPNLKAGDRLLAVRLTRNLRGLGWVVEPQAILRVDSVGPTRAVAQIQTQFADLRVGDLAIPLPAVPTMPADNMTEVSGGPRGEIIEFLIDQPLIGTGEYVFVSLGATQGITIGDELLAFVPERKVSEKRVEILPEQAVARLRVIKVTPTTSSARVIGIENASLRKGLPVRVARKAP